MDRRKQYIFRTYKRYVAFIESLPPQAHYETNCDKANNIFEVFVYERL